MQLTGTVTHILPEQSGTSKAGKAWSKAGFVIEMPGEYPKSVAIETFGDKVELPGLGEEVTVSVNIESREWNGKWFTNVTAWKVESNGGGVAQPEPDPIKAGEEDGPLPF